MNIFLHESKRSVRFALRLPELISAVLCIMCLVSCFASCGTRERKDGAETGAAPAAPVRLLTPENGAADVYAANKLVRMFLNGKYSFDTDDPYSEFEGLPSGGAQAQAVSFKWINGEGARADTLHLATDPSFTDELRFAVAGDGFEVENLMGGTTYYWKVTGQDGSYSGVFSFTTAFLPRILSIDGVSNCRDIGGWPTENGGRIRQGMVYRTATLDNITEEGVAFCRDVLHIRTELDLRNEGEGTAGSTALGEGVNYIRISPPYYIDDGHGLYDEKFTEGMRQILAVFADADNYPILFHCSAGVDRTGSVAFVLEALCGMNREDIFHEHDLSLIQFLPAGHKDTLIDHYSRLFSPMYQSLAERGNGTLSENTARYCRDIGVTDGEIDAIRLNLIESAPGKEDETSESPMSGENDRSAKKGRINIPVVIAAAAAGLIIICAAFFAFRKKKL